MDRPLDEDLRKGAVESDFDPWGDPPQDDQPWSSHAVELTKDVMSADVEDVKHAERELGADDDGTPG